MHDPRPVTLHRDITAIQIPVGTPALLPAGSLVYVTQSLGGSHTVSAFGSLYRVAGGDADALGLSAAGGNGADTASPGPGKARAAGPVDEKLVWDQLKTCYDPEIPVNIVDLGLVYDLAVHDVADGTRVDVKMTLTAPGCGMGTAIASDARYKIEAIPGVFEANVELVWDPPWSAEMMSPDAKRTLGIA